MLARCLASLYVGESMEETIERRGVSFLWIFGKPYSWGGVLYLLARDFLCAVDKPPLLSTFLSASATFFSTFDVGLFLRRL